MALVEHRWYYGRRQSSLSLDQVVDVGVDAKCEAVNARAVHLLAANVRVEEDSLLLLSCYLTMAV